MIIECKQRNEGAVPGKPIVVPTYASTLTSQETTKDVHAMILIKEKGSGELRGRMHVNGSMQKQYLK